MSSWIYQKVFYGYIKEINGGVATPTVLAVYVETAHPQSSQQLISAVLFNGTFPTPTLP